MIEQLLQADRLLQVDQVDQARDMYQRVVDLDPANAIAMVGLAQCALADGEDHRAHDLAARALVIDPENDMARRMEARLAEILAMRGEPVDRPASADGPGGREMRSVVTAPASQSGVASASDAVPLAPPAPPESSRGIAVNGPEPAVSAASPSAASSPSASLPEAPTGHRSWLDRLMGR